MVQLYGIKYRHMGECKYTHYIVKKNSVGRYIQFNIINS